jgi:hypothetical protein
MENNLIIEDKPKYTNKVLNKFWHKIITNIFTNGDNEIPLIIIRFLSARVLNIYLQIRKFAKINDYSISDVFYDVNII